MKREGKTRLWNPFLIASRRSAGKQAEYTLRYGLEHVKIEAVVKVEDSPVKMFIRIIHLLFILIPFGSGGLLRSGKGHIES